MLNDRSGYPVMLQQQQAGSEWGRHGPDTQQRTHLMAMDTMYDDRDSRQQPTNMTAMAASYQDRLSAIQQQVAIATAAASPATQNQAQQVPPGAYYDQITRNSSEPGRVLLLRNLAAQAAEEDVESYVSPFARCGPPKIYLQFGAGQAFVEFGTVQEAQEACRYYKVHQPSVKGQVVQVCVSDRECVTSMDDKAGNTKVLLATVTNLMYPVDIELLRFLFSRFGTVQKVVSFNKANSANTFQALVQMADPQQAMEALKNLHGRNIYDGCNTLQIQPSRMTELVVRTNNSRSWDYTLAPQGAPTRPSSAEVGGLITSQPTRQLHQTQMSPELGPRRQFDENQGPVNAGLLARCNSPGFNKVFAMTRLPREARDWKASLVANNVMPSPVLIVYNLTPKLVTVTELFNVFSLYGVLLRIKILRDKPHTALLQYSDPLYASLAAHFLQGAPLFDDDPGMQIGFSRNSEVKLSTAVGTEALKRTRAFQPQEQRYTISEVTTPEVPNEVEKFIKAACVPTCTLFIANLRDNVTEREVRELVAPHGAVKKVQLKSPPDGSRRKYAMVEVSNRNEALRALAHLHNTAMDNSTIKVAFSKVVISDQWDGEEEAGGNESPIHAPAAMVGSSISSQHQAALNHSESLDSLNGGKNNASSSNRYHAMRSMPALGIRHMDSSSLDRPPSVKGETNQQPLQITAGSLRGNNGPSTSGVIITDGKIRTGTASTTTTQ